MTRRLGRAAVLAATISAMIAAATTAANAETLAKTLKKAASKSRAQSKANKTSKVKKGSVKTSDKGAAPVIEARLGYVRNGVEIEGAEKKPGQVGDSVSPGDRVRTQAGSAAEIALSNGTLLRLDEQTEVVLFAAPTKAKPQRGKRGKPKISNTTLVSGRLRVVIGEGAPGATINNTTSAVPIEGEAQVEVTGSAIRVLVYRGKAKLGVKKQAIDVAPGFFSKMEKRKKPSPPQPLPSAPEWTVPPTPLGLSTEPTGDVAGKYAAGGGSGPAPDRWHIQVARDPRFSDLVMDVRIGAAVTTLLAEKLPAGRYVSRVSAVSTDGLEGPFGSASSSVVATARLSGGDPQGPALIEVTPPGLRCGLDGATPSEVSGPIEIDPTRDHKLACEVGTAVARLAFAATRKPSRALPKPTPEPLLPISAGLLPPQAAPPATKAAKGSPGATTPSTLQLGVSAGVGIVEGGKVGPLGAVELSAGFPVFGGVIALGLRAGYERYSLADEDAPDADLVKDVLVPSLLIEYRILPSSSSWSPFVRLLPQAVFEYERLDPRAGTVAAWDGRFGLGAAAGTRLRAGPGDLRLEVGVRQMFDNPRATGSPGLGWLSATLGYALGL